MDEKVLAIIAIIIAILALGLSVQGTQKTSEQVQINYQNGTASCTVSYLGNLCLTNPIIFDKPFALNQKIAEHCFFNISSSYNNDIQTQNSFPAILTTATSWTGGMPAAKTELFGNTQHRFGTTSDSLRSIDAISFEVNVVTISSNVNAILLLQWTSDQITWNDLAGVNVNVHTLGEKISPSNNLPISAYTIPSNLFFRIAGQNGNGVADIPQFSSIYLLVHGIGFGTNTGASAIDNTSFVCFALTGLNANNDTTPIIMDWEAYACKNGSIFC